MTHVMLMMIVMLTYGFLFVSLAWMLSYDFIEL